MADPTTDPVTPDEPANAGHDDAPFYCPGCGRRADYRKECTGTPTAPHPPTEVVSTDELYTDDPENHTPAPASE